LNEEGYNKSRQKSSNEMQEISINKSSLNDDKSINARDILEDKRNEKNINQNLVRIELDKDTRHFPYNKFCLLFIPFVSMIIVSLLKGSHYHKSILNIHP
jgi:hypothetical protein